MSNILGNRWAYVTLLFFVPFIVNSYDQSLADYGDIRSYIRQQENELIADKVHTYVDFVQTIGFLESSNRYHVTSGTSVKYMGKYQFSKVALIDINMIHVHEDFLQNYYNQELSMYLYLLKNRAYLSKYINQFKGKTINHVKVTEAGILASAHLVGAGSVMKYFNSNGSFVPKDGNGTSMEKYMRQFETTDLTLDNYVFTLASELIIKTYEN
jgi:hypothetical protein